MNDVFLYSLEFVLTVSIIIVVRYLAPFIRDKIKISKYEWVADMIYDAVNAAEQTFAGKNQGNIKKSAVITFVKEVIQAHDIDISDKEIDAIIESCVYALKLAKSESEGAVRR